MAKSRRGRTPNIQAKVPAITPPAVDGAAVVPPPHHEPVQVQAEVSPPSEPAKLEKEVYLDERKILVDLEQKSSDQHDKAILNLNAGALGLTITFMEKIAPSPLPETMWMLATSWGSFIVSICAILLSFLTSQRACQRQRDILDEKLTKGPCDETNRWATWTERLTVSAYVLLVAGVILMAAFSWKNLGAKTMAKPAQGNTQNTGTGNPGTGTVPPKPPASPPVPSVPPPTKK